MTAPPTDEELMLAYAAGDIAAFETLYARHRGPLYRFIARGISPRATADECFLTGTAAEVIAAVQYDRRPIGEGKPGVLTQKLVAAFKVYANANGTPVVYPG